MAEGARNLGAAALALAALLAAMLLLIPGASGTHTVAVALADSQAVTLHDPGTPLTGQVQLTATTTMPASSVVKVDFQYAPAGGHTWTSIGNATTSPYSITWDTTPSADGLYDLRAVVTDTSAQPHVSPTVRDRQIANNSPVVTLEDPGTPLRATVPLTADIADGGNSGVAAVRFQWSPADGEHWSTIADVTPAQAATKVSTSLDTTTLGDGRFDLRALPLDANGKPSAAVPVRGRLVDNMPPTVNLADPGSPLSGRVTLSASANDHGSGVASVRFERARAGTGAWVRIGVATRAPYERNFDTTTVPNGDYDFRAVASDQAGNVAVSGIATGITVNNAPQQSAPSASIVGIVAPAHAVTLLGSIAGSAEHEAWAYGFTSAPPATVDGAPLPYTATGNQLVLLRYTDSSGWQIADVLRNSDGSAFKLMSPDTVASGPNVTGAMTPSGEAWIWVGETAKDGSSAYGLFHRAPGGRFQLDSNATQALGAATLQGLGSPPFGGQLQLGQTGDGQVYGVLIAPNQTPHRATVPDGSGGSVSIAEKLHYGQLSNGAWALKTAPVPSTYQPVAGDTVTLRLGDAQSPDAGWGTFVVERGGNGFAPLGLLLGHFQGDNWGFANTGLDALDLTDAVADSHGVVVPQALKADGNSVWIGAQVNLKSSPAGVGNVVARYEGPSGHVTASWCSLPRTNSCDQPLDPDHPAAVPDAIFQTGGGETALSLQDPNRVDVLANGNWSSVAAPGYKESGGSAFTGPGDGWLGGAAALGRWSAQQSTSPLASWPLPNRSPLTSVALPPGSGGATSDAGAVAVGLDGTTLLYDANSGWLAQGTPARTHHINLTSVAFNGPSSAFAVGQFGVIMHWDGNSWSEDPQSISLTQSQLNGVAFAPSGEGWAVGVDGTILHYDGQSWSAERPPPADETTNISSVTVAGNDVFAVAGGNLITRGPDGSWRDVDASQLPSDPAPVPGDLRVVAGLPDGGVIAAGRSVVLLRQQPGARFAYSEQPLEGIAVALSPFRDNGVLRTFVSLAPPALNPYTLEPSNDVAGFPPGDGELLRETPTGWQDLSRAQYADVGSSSRATLPGDGTMKSDPVLGVAASPDGNHAWVVGGYAGTLAASALGSSAILPARPNGWRTAAVWRYDAGGSAVAPTLAQDTPIVPAAPNVVSFAFFSSPMCRIQCSLAQNAQPDVNVSAAINEINTYAQQPGGPAYTVLGGNARGPVETDPGTVSPDNTAADFNHLPDLLAPLGVPLYAAFGPLDHVRNQGDDTQAWSYAFAGAPAPFGSGPAPPGVSPLSQGGSTGVVNRYYAFDTNQNGGTLRTIVLDNSKGSLEDSAPGQTGWLQGELNDAQASNTPVVVMTAQPLRSGHARDASAVASLLANAGVVAVFSTNYPSQLNEHYMVPDDAPPDAPQIPEYEGASLGYQQPQNNGVVWYFVSVDTAAQTLKVNAVPVIESVALKPLTGLNVARSATLQFDAVGRRPQGSLATRPDADNGNFPGYDNYVGIPAPSCGSRPCVQPTYAFKSSDPTIGDFVAPSGPGSPYPKLNAAGRPIHSSKSGLFCAFNSGSTLISVTAGLLSYSLPVTVQDGGFGPPCGTVKRAGVGRVIIVRSNRTPRPNASAAPPPPPPPGAAASSTALSLPPSLAHAPAPLPAPHPLPVIHQAVIPAPVPFAVPAVLPPLAIVPPPVTPAQPIPPGGAAVPGTAQSPAAAQRKEKARKHASQSAFTLLPPAVRGAPVTRVSVGSVHSSSGNDWFYGAVGVTTLLALMLTGRALRPKQRLRPALARNDDRPPRRR